MTRRLILIRHAKSGWDNDFDDDHARTLTDRGVKAAQAIGEWLMENGYTPDLILTSDAARALQTTQHVIKGLSQPVQTLQDPFLYHAAVETIHEIAQKATGKTIAIVGHNPGIGMAAQRFVSYAPAHHRFNDYPTCATTIIDFPSDHWIIPGKGIATDFMVPRDL